jgi:2-dehydropantoate 2-reductase
VLGDRPETRAILEAVVAEIFGVIEHSGHRTHWRSAREYLELFWSELLPATASHESSMLLDLRAGRRTEVDQLTGAVAALARQHGVSVPVCTALTQLIRGREDRLAALH